MIRIAWFLSQDEKLGRGEKWSNKSKYPFPKLEETFQQAGYSIFRIHPSEHSDLDALSTYDLWIIGNSRKDHLDLFRKAISRNPKLKLLILPFTYCADYIAPNGFTKNQLRNNIFAGFSNWIHNSTELIQRSNKLYLNREILPVPGYDLDVALSREEFCQKYKLDPKLKIIVFFNGRFDDAWFTHNQRRARHYHPYHSNRQLILNFHHLKEKLLKLGYQLVMKLHRRFNFRYFQEDHPNFNYQMYDQITFISDSDYPSLLRHVDAALIGNMTTVQFMLYLYGIKTVFVDGPTPEQSWIRFLEDCGTIQFTQPRFQKLTHHDIGFGTYAEVDSFIQNPNPVMNRLEQIGDSYRYLDDHPIYGESSLYDGNGYLRRIIQSIQRFLPGEKKPQ